jgi:hypothetical protein
MLLLEQIVSSLEKQQVLAQATHVGHNIHLQQAPIPVASESEEMNIPMSMGAESVLSADPHWDQNYEGVNGINVTSSIL